MILGTPPCGIKKQCSTSGMTRNPGTEPAAQAENHETREALEDAEDLGGFELVPVTVFNFTCDISR